MLLQFHSIRKLAKLVTVTSFTLLAGWSVMPQAAPGYNPLYDKEAVLFFQVVQVQEYDVLNLRRFPGYGNKKVGELSPNQECVAYLNEISRQWVKVTHKGVQGWASLRYLSRQDWGCGTHYQIVNARRNVIMYHSPNYDSKIVGKIPAQEQDCIIGLDEVELPKKDDKLEASKKDDEVELSENKQDKIKWVMLQYAGVKGWVNAYYLEEIDVDDCDV